MKACIACLFAGTLGAFAASALADRSSGLVLTIGLDPVTHLPVAQQSFGEASQSFFGDIALGPLQASAAGHPFDPPGTSGSLANLNFARPGFGDASYHSFAGSYALSYTPLPFEKSASTLFQLHGRLKLMPSDLQRLFGFLPPLVTLPVDTSFSLEGLFVAEAGPTVDDQARAGVRFIRALDHQVLMGGLSLQADSGGAPVITETDVLSGHSQAREFNQLELALMLPGAHTDFGLRTARGASLLYADVITELLTFELDTCLTQFCFGAQDYSTPIDVLIETWGELGESQNSVAIANLGNTLHFSFTVRDANGMPTDIPVFLALDDLAPTTPLPAPGSLALALAGLGLLARHAHLARRRAAMRSPA